MKSHLIDYPQLKWKKNQNAVGILIQVTETYQLAELKQCFKLWCEIAYTTNTPTIYSDKDRHILKRFATNFSPLMDAVFCIAKALNKNTVNEDFHEELDEYIANYTAPPESNVKMIDPFEFPDFFFSLCNIQLSRSILWALLEAVIIYKGPFDSQIIREDVVITYECFAAIIEGANGVKKIHRERKKD